MDPEDLFEERFVLQISEAFGALPPCIIAAF